VRLLLVLLAAAAALPSVPAPPAAAAGAWTTMLRPLSYTDVMVDGDTLWASSLEGGLLQHSLSTGRFSTISREPGGIASNQLTCLALDSLRQVWFGSMGSGVNRYSADRSRLNLLNTFDGLPSDTVNILEVQSDTVWIGTSRGIALWNGEEIAGRLPDGINASPFRSNDVRGIQRFGDDLWVATMDGVYRSSLASGLATWTQDTLGLPRRSVVRRTCPVIALACDEVTLICVSRVTVGGFDRDSSFRWDPPTTRWVAIDRAVDGRGVGTVSGVWDDAGKITGASTLGVLLWNGTRWKVVTDQIPSLPPRKFNVVTAALPDGRLVAATARRFCFVDTAGPFTCTQPPGPPGNNVQDLALEGSRLYVTSDDDGIGRWDGQQWKYWIPGGPFRESDTTFRAPAYPYGFLVDKLGRKWVGCWSSAFERFTDSLATPHFEHLHRPVPDGCGNRDPATSHTFSTCSALDSAGGHWFGLDTPCAGPLPARGLDYYGPGSDSIPTTYSPPAVASGIVRALTVTSDGRIWVGYGGSGIQVFTPPPTEADSIHPVPVANTGNYFVAGLAARGTEVWALVGSDLHHFRGDGAPLGSYDAPGAASASAHHPVDVAPDGSVWFGTTQGVGRVRPDGGTETYNMGNSPLAGNDVHAVRVDRLTGVVWLGTGSGLSRFDPSWVPPAPPAVEQLDVQVYPNPIRLTNLGVPLRLTGEATEYQGRVLDLSGRRIREFTVHGNGRIVWDGRDAENNLVRPGIYFVHVRAAGAAAVVRVAVIR
jgi:streptogramin lyase